MLKQWAWFHCWCFSSQNRAGCPSCTSERSIMSYPQAKQHSFTSFGNEASSIITVASLFIECSWMDIYIRVHKWNYLCFLTKISTYMEEDGGSPTVTGFIQQNTVGSCSPNILQISWGKFQNFNIYTVNVSTNVVFFRCEQVWTGVNTWRRPHWSKCCVWLKVLKFCLEVSVVCLEHTYTVRLVSYHVYKWHK